MDVFVMLVSLSLAARFKQVVERLRAAVCERVSTTENRSFIDVNLF